MPESYTVPNPESLDASKHWFVTGLLYAYTGLPKSIFDFCPAPKDVDDSVTTLLMPEPVYVPHLFTIPGDERAIQWAHTVQGVPVKRAMHFLTQIDGMMFRQKEGNWVVKVKPLTLADQLSRLRSVKIFYLLPASETVRLDIGGIVNGNAALLREYHGKGK